MVWFPFKKSKYSLKRIEKIFTTRKHEKEIQLPSLRAIRFVFRFCYAWPPENADERTMWWYRVKGIIFRIFFIYLCTIAQIAYNFTVTTREELFAGIFILLTQLVMIMKMEFFYKNMTKIQSLLRRFEGDLYISRNAEEDIPLARARNDTSKFWLVFFIFSAGLIIKWSIASFIYNRTLVTFWPSVDDNSPYWLYLMVNSYQFLAMFVNASFNMSWDTLVAALLSLTNAHLHRLNIQLMKVGHNGKSTKYHDGLNVIDVDPITRQLRNSPEKSDDGYDELLRCIIFHQDLIGILRDLLELFGGPMLAQLYCSVFIMCITEFRLLTDVNSTDDAMFAVDYLICLIIQVVQYCYFGNEVNYMSQKVHQATSFMNYPDMNIKTRKLLIMFQQVTAKGIKCCAKKLFSIELSMATFVTLLKTSYSLLAVLRSMMDEKNTS